MIRKYNEWIEFEDEEDDFDDESVTGIGMLIGKTLADIDVQKDVAYGDAIIFTTNNGIQYSMYHDQNCCECVSIEDIVGDLSDLIGTPIIKASEDTNNENPKEGTEYSHTWTFYNISTIKGHVTIRWYGYSNGYYSERVGFYKI